MVAHLCQSCDEAGVAVIGAAQGDDCDKCRTEGSARSDVAGRRAIRRERAYRMEDEMRLG